MRCYAACAVRTSTARHPHRYLAEFDFRYYDQSALGVKDVVRSKKAVVGAKRKRLTYRQPDQQ